MARKPGKKEYDLEMYEMLRTKWIMDVTGVTTRQAPNNWTLRGWPEGYRAKVVRRLTEFLISRVGKRSLLKLVQSYCVKKKEFITEGEE